ncbi:DUF1194 domain-containing protein [Amaricoccus sp.]|uniref:DUF1194 domain-containing protein n=1 Tax=Amaricoccus sp. TaxID=1872485 RepID=UPI001B492A0D|nr:DUF1194 domain-containing protein [Amaricoccus sp.]MBP7241338.1 DUF1194 domain-containing protein [Amaricoccus sp.]
MEKRPERRPLVAAALALGLAAAAPAAAQDCRIALALAIDVSSSVDAAEYRLQAGGLAAALRDAQVAAAFLAVPGQVVELTIFEWSGRRQQATALDWTTIASADDLYDVAARLEAWPRAFARHATAIGEAMLYGAEALAGRPDCPERIIDVSGDGETNDGISPLVARQSPLLEGVTVNGLVIGVTRRILRRHYEAFVIHGPGAFVEMADDHGDFSRAMRRKLIRELQPRAISMAD